MSDAFHHQCSLFFYYIRPLYYSWFLHHQSYRSLSNETETNGFIRSSWCNRLPRHLLHLNRTSTSHFRSIVEPFTVTNFRSSIQVTKNIDIIRIFVQTKYLRHGLYRSKKYERFESKEIEVYLLQVEVNYLSVN